MKKIMKDALQVVDIRDLFCFGGLAMVGYGTHQIYPPAAWIVVGVVLYWIGIRNGHSRND